MITISHISGPLAGQSQSFDDEKNKIEFGREPDCDVVYPQDEMIVGHRHFALVNELGDWVLHIHEGSQGLHFVSVNGEPAESGKTVDSGSIFHLGRKDGPSLAVKFDQAVDSTGGGMTAVEEKTTSTRVLFRRLTIAGGAIAVVLVAVVGGTAYKNYTDQQQLAATFASLAKDQKQATDTLIQLRTAAAARIDQNIIDHLVRATFLVYKQDAQGRQFADGTAWVIGPDLLATNAHIAALCSDFQPGDDKLAACDDLKPNEKLFVRSAGADGATYEVIGHSFHPGYVAFPKFVLSMDPAIASFRGAAPTQVGSDGYDVGLLRIKGQFPADLALEVASKAELEMLKPGMPLASAGYPSENIYNSDVLTVAATPQIHYGNISALTDSLFLPTDPAHDFLIQNSIPMTGGSSGSPVVNASGHVIALLNSANFGPAASGWVRGAPSGAEINYAQRADFVADLLAGNAQAVFASDMDYWKRQVANFQRGIDVMSAWVLDRGKPDAKAVAQLISTNQGKLTADDMRVNPDTKKKERVKVEKLNLSAGTRYLIFVYAENNAEIKIYLKDSNNQTVVDNTNSEWYPNVSFNPTTAGTWSLVVSGPDDDISYTMRLYSWQSSGS
jgi:hypothetical protein